MKKSDEATGMIIEVPESMNFKSKFPYPGFWTGAYPLLLNSLMKDTSLKNAPKAAVSEALNKSIDMLNGEYALFLTEKIWSIGELMNLNPMLPVEGRVGNLGYIKSAADGGRMEVAAKLFEPAISAMINQNSGIINSQQNLTSFSNELQSFRNEQLRLNTKLAELEASTPTESKVMEQERMCEQYKRSLSVLGDEINELTMRVQDHETSSRQRMQMETELKTLQSELAVMQRKIVAGSESPNDRRMYAKLKQRVENLGLSLQRGQYGSNSKLARDYSNLLHYKTKEYQKMLTEFNNCTSLASQMRSSYYDGVREGQMIWSQIKQISSQIEASQNSIAKAQNSVMLFSNDDSRNLVKIWVAHLSEARTSIEGALFQAKYQATAALQGSPRAMFAESLPIDPALIRDYEAFNTALTDISDNISDSEYDVLEQIGRLGLSMMYVPGEARITAIGDMRQGERLNAYRNLIEEILAQGQRISEEQSRTLLNVGIRDLGIEIKATNELKEVKELLRHLADSKLNFKYGGGV